jgi:hypothetical protein
VCSGVEAAFTKPARQNPVSCSVRNPLADYMTALLLTLATETAVALAMGYRDVLSLQTVVLCSLMTHPLLHCAVRVLVDIRIEPINTGTILLLELFVVLAEWQILWYVLQRERVRLLLLSAVMNGASFVLGIVLSC